MADGINRYQTILSARTRVLGVLMFLVTLGFDRGSAADAAPSQVGSSPFQNSTDDDRIRVFRVAIPQTAIDDLTARLDRVHWADELPGAGWDYGVPLDYVKKLVTRWRTHFDWRAYEAKINSRPQFTTQIDGQTIHFIQVRSPMPGARPLLLLHGWPGSVAEYLDLIGPLTDPTGTAGARDDPFDIVIPSLPGFAFSGPTRERGWDEHRIARAMTVLMKRLGYQHYGVVGNDWGTGIAFAMSRAAPAAVTAVHVTQIFSEALGVPGELDGLPEDDRAALEGQKRVGDTFGSYSVLQSQQPQTLAHALADSPVGLLAWTCQIYRGGVDEDFILTNASTYWLTGTVASSMRLYYESHRAAHASVPTTVPVGFAQFRNDYHSVRRFADRDHKNIVSWNAYDRGDHFAAISAPDLLVADIRKFFHRFH